MAWVLGMVKLDCPTCGKVTESIGLKLDFILVDGVRHRTGETWELSCGHVLHDALVNWDTDEDDDGVAWSALVDKETDEVLLAWSDGKAAPPACDCEDCDCPDLSHTWLDEA